MEAVRVKIPKVVMDKLIRKAAEGGGFRFIRSVETGCNDPEKMSVVALHRLMELDKQLEADGDHTNVHYALKEVLAFVPLETYVALAKIKDVKTLLPKRRR